MADSLVTINNANNLVQGDNLNTANAYIKRNSDNSFSAGQANVGSINTSGALLLNNTVVTTSSQTIPANAGAVLGNATSGNQTLALQSPSAVDGHLLLVAKTDSSGNDVIVSGNINGSSGNKTISTQGNALLLYSDGTTWHPFTLAGA